MTSDYNHLNKPTEIIFEDGNRQTITYDGFGNKKRVDYSVGPETVIGGDIPADDSYTVTSSRVYSGKHIFTDGELEYSGFEGGYFDANGSANYYIDDWQGNVVVVINDNDGVIQATNYYPYGEPLEEPSGQPYLFGGKERDHFAGRNTYDFGARCLAPYGRWTVVDKKAYKYYSLSPYAYCAGDPINFYDPDGNEVKCLSNDENLLRAADLYYDNGNIIVFIHGSPNSMDYNIHQKHGKIKSAEEFTQALQKEFDLQDIDKPLFIELHSCRTGLIDDKHPNPIAKQISKELKHAIVKAPNGYLNYDFEKNSENVYSNPKRVGKDANGKPKLKKRIPATPAWRYFYQGEEIEEATAKIIMLKLIFEYLFNECKNNIKN